jgi:uncharacterized protein
VAAGPCVARMRNNMDTAADGTHAELLGQFLTLPGIHGNLIPDAHLAALAVEHGLTLWSTDGDFARFRGLRWLNPIAP